MRFATRTFLWSFLPIAFLLPASFWTIQTLTLSSVRDELRSSLRRSQIANAQVRAKSELQNSRFLRIVGDNAPLKAGLQLIASDPRDADARRTVEDQLTEICENLGFDFLLVSNADGQPLVGVIGNDQLSGGVTSHEHRSIVSMDIHRLRPPKRGFYTTGSLTYQVTSVPVNQAEESIGILSVGERFDFTDFSTPAVLTKNGRVLKFSVPETSASQLELALKSCRDQSECNIRLANQTYLSLPMDSIYFGDGYVLRSLQNVDSASGSVQSILRKVFLAAGITGLLAALLLSVLSARSIVRPISTLISKLRESVKTGILPRFEPRRTPILEIGELMESFNRAAASIQDGEDNLRRAYVEFVGSLANALDARDRYTAGHSQRVSDSACEIAEAMNLPAGQIGEIRIGALLHDIGKIGIEDAVLQKTGKLTPEEFSLIQQHPTIGKRILEGVHGFHSYLPIVELHHENWDGSGYPLGLSGDSVPLNARIVHVVDAYDAMTSDRPYRRGMSHAKAVTILEKFAGSQFDPAVADVFAQLIRAKHSIPRDDKGMMDSLDSLTQTLSSRSEQLERTPA